MLCAALWKTGASPLFDRGIVLVSMAAAIALGATSMSDIAVLAHLAPMLGAAPSGLALVVSAAIDACPPQGISFTLEIHQVEGRLPLADAAWLFPHWRDTTNAERMNYWLSVLSENVMLVAPACRPHLAGNAA